MPVDTQQIMDAADKLGQMVAQHPAIDKYKQAQSHWPKIRTPRAC